MSLRVAEPIACRLERLTCGAGSPGVEAYAPGINPVTLDANSPSRHRLAGVTGPDVSLPENSAAGPSGSAVFFGRRHDPLCTCRKCQRGLD